MKGEELLFSYFWEKNKNPTEMRTPRSNNLPVILLLLCFTGLSSCSKDVDDELSLLGNWIEESPVEGRTQLIFHSIDRVSRTDSDGFTEVFNYRIEDQSIYLWPEGQSEAEGSSELFFKQIDENTFQIENLYVSIPENEPTFMIFERE